MNQQVEKFIPEAVDAVKKNLCFEKDKKQCVNQAYQGYIASYGAAITQSGLLAATAMFSNENKGEKTKGDKPYLMDTILYLLQKTGKIPGTEQRLFDYVLAHPELHFVLKHQILQASIAIKLAIRTFKLVN